MTYWTAILLGLIQGLAEFLPISSSGHLAILQNFLRIGDLENQMLFDVLLHLGTLGAVIFAYHTELRGLCREGLMLLHLQKPKRGARQDPARRRLLLFLIAATLPLIPAAFLSDYLDSLFYDTFFIGFALIATGFLLLAADRYGHGNKTEKAMTLSDALVIGLAQMIAVVPGLSRSGTTISAGMLPTTMGTSVSEIGTGPMRMPLATVCRTTTSAASKASEVRRTTDAWFLRFISTSCCHSGYSGCNAHILSRAKPADNRITEFLPRPARWK